MGAKRKLGPATARYSSVFSDEIPAISAARLAGLPGVPILPKIVSEAAKIFLESDSLGVVNLTP